MAREFLSIPAASVAVEQLFSGARHLCADTRSSLKGSTITQAMCTKRWIKEGLFDLAIQVDHRAKLSTKVNLGTLGAGTATLD
jgi:hypothetical protein